MELVLIRISTENAAFGETDEEAGQEVARILRKLADQMEQPSTGTMALHDLNGNKVGTAMVE